MDGGRGAPELAGAPRLAFPIRRVICRYTAPRRAWGTARRGGPERHLAGRRGSRHDGDARPAPSARKGRLRAVHCSPRPGRAAGVGAAPGSWCARVRFAGCCGPLEVAHAGRRFRGDPPPLCSASRAEARRLPRAAPDYASISPALTGQPSSSPLRNPVDAGSAHAARMISPLQRPRPAASDVSRRAGRYGHRSRPGFQSSRSSSPRG
jgi:hypothetical protein